MNVQCFLLQPTDTAQRSLRRYWVDGSPACPGPGGYHNAVVAFEVVSFTSEYDGCGDDSWPHSDPRWPATCNHCPYVFKEDDSWQVNLKRVFRRADTGETMTQEDAPAGAMRWADWSPVHSAECIARGGGPHLLVKLPDGVFWDLDGPASRDYRQGGSGWTREGEPPQVTANPSILTSRYHGWLRAGVLVEC